MAEKNKEILNVTGNTCNTTLLKKQKNMDLILYL